MSRLPIKIYGDPILKVKALPIETIGPEEKKALEDMAKTMYDAEGAGLAATQVGINKQLMVVDVGNGLLKLANPKLIKGWCNKVGEEGCLSFPGIRLKIKRPEKVVLEALNQDGDRIRIEAQGLLARVLHHEMDHLKGVVIIDRVGIRQRLLVAARLWRLKRLNKKQGG
jgi:peptide deformylase